MSVNFLRPVLLSMILASPCAAQTTPAPATPGAAVQTVDLAFRAIVGDTLRYNWAESTWQRTAPIETAEGGQVREGALEATAAFTIKEKTAEGWTLELAYERIKVSAKAGEREVAYDSANPGPEPEPVDGKKMERAFEASIKPLVGHKITVKLNASGEVVEVTGFEMLIDMTAPTARFALLLMGKESIASKFGAAFGTWRPQGAASTWQSTQLVPYVPGILFEVAYEHTMKAPDAGIVEISAAGTPTLKVPNPRGLGTREIKSSSISYTQKWNTTEGRADSATFNQNSEVLLKAQKEGPGSQALVKSKMAGRLSRSVQVEAGVPAGEPLGDSK